MSESLLTLTAALLRRGRGIDLLNGGLTLLVAAVGLYLAGAGRLSFGLALVLVIVLALGLWQKLLAIRVALDAELFASTAVAADLGAATEALDAALLALKLVPPGQQGRDWRQRSQGALKLLRWQAGVALGQWLLVAACLLFSPSFT
ncbi:MAG: hypothetical protein GAK43_00500 [Stenotrophomonas maltophilia]|nr:MAG: hypothetical protein GAK43_00500 [Stenotrophomonas maltophilia]